MKVAKFLSIFGVAAIAATPFALAIDAETPQALYEVHCGSCHMVDGGGVPMMQPELIETPRANEAKGGVIDMILKGSAAVPEGTSEFGNEMPAFDFLTDEEIAKIATYVRTNFDNKGGAVTADDVRSRRSK